MKENFTDKKSIHLFWKLVKKGREWSTYPAFSIQTLSLNGKIADDRIILSTEALQLINKTKDLQYHSLVTSNKIRHLGDNYQWL